MAVKNRVRPRPTIMISLAGLRLLNIRSPSSRVMASIRSFRSKMIESLETSLSMAFFLELP